MTKNDAHFFETHPHRRHRERVVSDSRSQFDRFRQDARKIDAGEEDRFNVKLGEFVLLEEVVHPTGRGGRDAQDD